MVKAVVFDVDDTLIKDSEHTIHLPTWLELFKDILKDEIQAIPQTAGANSTEVIEQVLRNINIKVGMQPLDVIRAVLRHKNIPDDNSQIAFAMEVRRREILNQFIADPKSDIELNDGAKRLLKGCKEARRHVVFNTSGPLEYAQTIIERFKLGKYVDFVVSGGLTDAPKPAVHSFDYIYNHLKRDIPDLKRWEVVVVGDSGVSDVEGAKRAGMRAIGFAVHTSLPDLYQHGADLAVANLLEIKPYAGGTFDSYPFTMGRRKGESSVPPLQEYAWIRNIGKERR